ncbi:MAG: hypothetical protein CL609_09570 [Anaerolineaceae bacterium]|nr:hypothetical protein [Anaerolineaceae bacterium]
MIKFGITLPNYGPDAGRLSIIDTAVAAERLGFDSIWVTDHLALPVEDGDRFGHIYEAMTTLAFLGASTRQIKLGFSTLVLPQRNPIEVAKQIATLDVLSGGRIIFTAGIGWSAGEYKNLGYEFKNRGKRMDEALRVLRTCWRGQTKVSFNGIYYQFQDMVFSPTPLQPGGPPLWVAGDSSIALRRAILLGDGWHPNASSAARLKTQLENNRTLINNRPFTVAVRFRLDFEEKDSTVGGLTGSAQDIINTLKDYQDAGMQVALINFSAKNQNDRERAMRRFMQDIKPALV